MSLESANVVDVIDKLGSDIVSAARLLGNGDASTHMGAIEAHGKAVLDGCANVADAIRELAEAIRESLSSAESIGWRSHPAGGARGGIARPGSEHHSSMPGGPP